MFAAAAMTTTLQYRLCLQGFPGSYVACIYDGLWWIGLIHSVSEEHGIYLYMALHDPSDDLTSTTFAGCLKSMYYVKY